MAGDDGLNESDLKLLVMAKTAFELVARPLKDGRRIWWTIDVVLGDGKAVMLTKARRKYQRKVWRQLSALYKFVRATVPDVERITVLMDPEPYNKGDLKDDTTNSSSAIPG